MTIWVYRGGRLVAKHLAAPRAAGPHVISDYIPDMVHPANGKKYDSKSTFRRVTRDNGYIEVGTEKQTDRRQSVHQNFEADVHEAIRKVNEGYRPHSEAGNYSEDGWQ